MLLTFTIKYNVKFLLGKGGFPPPLFVSDFQNEMDVFFLHYREEYASHFFSVISVMDYIN